MKFLHIINDILVLKNRNLSHEEREEVTDEIFRINDLLKPLGIARRERDFLSIQPDNTLVEMLYQQYQLFAIKSLRPSENTENNLLSFVII